MIELILLALLQDDAVKAGMDAVKPEAMRKHLMYIASDELEGRLAGEKGNVLAAEYIAKIYQEAGLKPIGDDGTYFQKFTVGRRGKTVETRNTVALLEGTDLKDQFVIIGAHHDHVGRKGMRDVGQLGGVKDGDEIWNGADDNGSGTCCLITLVQAMKASGLRPKRSIVFMTWSAEEWGLLGSKHCAAHPIVPLEKTVAYYNMDMMGRGDLKKETGVSGLLTAQDKVFNEIVEHAAKASGLTAKLVDCYGPGSDHESWAAKRIPVVSWCENGPCPDYHCVTDHADKINYEYMAVLARTVLHALVELANRPEPPRWNPEYKPPTPSPDEKPRLGIGAESLSKEEVEKLGLKDQGAVVITAVMDNSMAAKIGLVEDDVILAIGGKPLPVEDARAGLRSILDGVERGKECVIEYVRGAERKKATATWPKP